jgi:NADH:ubiquinone oxidoreductase subunit E
MESPDTTYWDAADQAVQHVSCLGACGQAPVLVVDAVLVTKLPIDQPEALDAVFKSAGMQAAGGMHARASRPRPPLTPARQLGCCGASSCRSAGNQGLQAAIETARDATGHS